MRTLTTIVSAHKFAEIPKSKREEVLMPLFGQKLQAYRRRHPNLTEDIICRVVVIGDVGYEVQQEIDLFKIEP